MAKDQIRITFNIGGSKQLDGAEQTGYRGTVLQTIYKVIEALDIRTIDAYRPHLVADRLESNYVQTRI